jgi:hypothetical protein
LIHAFYSSSKCRRSREVSRTIALLCESAPHIEFAI